MGKIPFQQRCFLTSHEQRPIMTTRSDAPFTSARTCAQRFLFHHLASPQATSTALLREWLSLAPIGKLDDVCLFSGSWGVGTSNSGSANQQSHTHSKSVWGGWKRGRSSVWSDLTMPTVEEVCCKQLAPGYSIAPTHAHTNTTHTLFCHLRHHAQSCSLRCPAESCSLV